MLLSSYTHFFWEKVYVYDLRAEGPLCTMPNKTFEFSNDEINSVRIHRFDPFFKYNEQLNACIL